MKTRKITEDELRNSDLPLKLIAGKNKLIITEIRGNNCAYEDYDRDGEFICFDGDTVAEIIQHYEIEVKESERFYKYATDTGGETNYFYSDDLIKYWDGKGVIVKHPMPKGDWKKTSNYIEV